MALFSKKKFSIEDDDFGILESIKYKDGAYRWSTEMKIDFFDDSFGIMLIGDENGPFKESKKVLYDYLDQYDKKNKEVTEILLDTLRNNDPDTHMNHWNEKFELFGFDVYEIGGDNNRFSISFIYKENSNYIFNVHFKDMETDGVSIDS